MGHGVVRSIHFAKNRAYATKKCIDMQRSTDTPSSDDGTGGGYPMLATDEDPISHDRPDQGTPEPNHYSLLANLPEPASITRSAFLRSSGDEQEWWAWGRMVRGTVSHHNCRRCLYIFFLSA
jgi:hypothetical protein